MNDHEIGDSVGRPNILWISTHDINPHLGTYGGVWPGAEQAHTPHLDRLAREGVRFDQAYAVAPVCAPSRSSIMTGCYPTSIGTMHMRSNAVLPPEVRLLPELLREHGYYTVNNWFRDFQTEVPPTAFDDASSEGHWRNRPNGVPFFAAFHGLVTHESQIYLPDEEFEAATGHVDASLRHDPASVEIPPYHPRTRVFTQAWARYLDLITEMDQWVGRLLDQLDEDGLTDSTMVVFWSDHGAGFPRAKRWAGEAGLRVPLIVRWPGRLARGAVVEEPVGMVDLAPTMLSAAEVPVPDYMQGERLFDARGAMRVPRRYVFGGRDRMDEQEDTVRTVRDERFRYIRNLHPDRGQMQHCHYPDALPTWAELRWLSFEESRLKGLGFQPTLLDDAQRALVAPSKPSESLYDLRADPHEMVDLVADARFADDLARLRGALDEWLAEYGDLGAIPESELIDRWRPGGRQRPVAAPQLAPDGSVTCATPGARVGWTTTPPTGVATSREYDVMGMGQPDGRDWHPLSTYGGQRPVWFKAWRPGFEASAELTVELGAHARNTQPVR